MPESSLTFYGTKWCGDCLRVKFFLDRKKIMYKWINIDHDPEAEAFVIKTNGGLRSVPTIVFEDGTILVEPSTKTLAEKLNLD